MSSKGLQSLHRKATRGNENRRCTVFTLAVNNGKSGNNDVLPTDVMQLSGHKNVQSITSYSTVSQKQQLNMSHTLTGFSSGEIAPQSGSSIPEKRKHEFYELIYPTFRPTFSQQSKQAAQQPLSLFYEYESHSHWNEFEKNNSPVWLFYSGEKNARV